MADDGTGAEQPRAPRRDTERDPRTGTSAPEARIARQAEYVDQQVRLAMARGEFDDLPGAGKPLELGAPNDRDWWLKKLIERERITGVLPPALQLRKDDLELAELIDQQRDAAAVREVVEDFNGRVVAARRQLTGGPPVVTPTRDVATEIAGWRERRNARRRAAARLVADREAEKAAEKEVRRRRRWRRRSGQSQR